MLPEGIQLDEKRSKRMIGNKTLNYGLCDALMVPDGYAPGIALVESTSTEDEKAHLSIHGFSYRPSLLHRFHVPSVSLPRLSAMAMAWPSSNHHVYHHHVREETPMGGFGCRPPRKESKERSFESRNRWNECASRPAQGIEDWSKSQPCRTWWNWRMWNSTW